MLDLREALALLDTGVMVGHGNERFNSISTDSRADVAGSLYVALRGERFDGHDFTDQALAAGAVACLVDAQYPARAPALRVPDTRRALGELARGWRRRFRLPLIAVTGSNGKTTVKEMLAAILVQAVGEPAALATRGNFNNEIGVPLTVFRLRAGHRLAVLELGMNRPGEIAWLARIAQPTIALVNNAQREHQEFLDGVAATARENGMSIASLPTDGIAVFPGDDESAPIWASLAGTRARLTFGLSDEPGRFDVQAAGDSQPAGFTIQLREQSFPVSLAIDGQHNVRNALAATACALAAGVLPAQIAQGLARFTPAAGRMRRVAAAPGVTLIDDTYNANPDSVRAAIAALAAHPGPRILILGDMAELGAQGPAWHAEVGEFARRSGIDRMLALGPLCREAVGAFGAGAEHVDSMATLIEAATAAAAPGTTVLVKGSRAMAMEAVIATLVANARTGGQEGACCSN